MTLEPQQDIIRLFLEAERTGRLFECLVDGIPVWWFMRIRVFDLIRKTLGGAGFGPRGVERLSPLQSARKGLSSVSRLLRPRPLSGPIDILALSTASARRYRTENGLDYDVYFDFLSGIPGFQYAVVEFPDSTTPSESPFSRQVLYGDSIALAGNSGRVLNPHISTSPEVTRLADRVLESVRGQGLQVSREDLNNVISRELGFVRFTRRLADRIIQQHRPRIVMVECGYAPSHMIVQYCARQRGVPVVELQHGLISGRSIGYLFSLSEGASLRNSPFPDVLCVYGRHFRELLAENHHISSERYRVTGHPFLFLEMQKRKTAYPSRDPSGDVLITSQPGLSAFWSHFAIDLAAKIPNRIVIKPHPAEVAHADIEFAGAQGHPRVLVLRENGSLYDILDDVSFHLSVASTSHLEAIAFGVKDIIVSDRGLESQFQFLTDMGVPLVKNAEEAANVIANYPCIARAQKYVRDNVFALDLNPVQEIAALLSSLLPDGQRL